MSARRAAAALAALLLAACFSLEGPQRRERLEALLAESEVLVVIDPAVHLAFVRVEDALTFSSGFAGGERLRAQFELPSPAPGFAEAFVAALRENPRFAPTPFVLGELDDVREALAARGVAPVFFASVGSPPAANVAAGRGAMALPDRLWSGDCTFRGPESALPIEAWAERLVAFLERGEEQGPFDEGELDAEEQR